MIRPTFIYILISLSFTLGVIKAEKKNLIIKKITSEKDWHNLIITDPAISTRCNRLISKRKDKIRLKQKISYLIVRTKKLLDKTKANQVVVKTKLNRTLKKLEREGRLAKLSLQKMTENIILKGCPGIDL